MHGWARPTSRSKDWLIKRLGNLLIPTNPFCFLMQIITRATGANHHTGQNHSGDGLCGSSWNPAPYETLAQLLTVFRLTLKTRGVHTKFKWWEIKATTSPNEKLKIDSVHILIFQDSWGLNLLFLIILSKFLPPCPYIRLRRCVFYFGLVWLVFVLFCFQGSHTLNGKKR